MLKKCILLIAASSLTIASCQATHHSNQSRKAKITKKTDSFRELELKRAKLVINDFFKDFSKKVGSFSEKNRYYILGSKLRDYALTLACNDACSLKLNVDKFKKVANDYWPDLMQLKKEKRENNAQAKKDFMIFQMGVFSCLKNYNTLEQVLKHIGCPADKIDQVKKSGEIEFYLINSLGATAMNILAT